MTSAIATMSQARNGKPARYTSPIVVSGGATLFIVNRLSPKGGVVVAISELIIYITANHTGLKPTALTIGINIGRVIIITAPTEINIPRINRTICMPMRRKIGATGRFETNAESPVAAPLYDNI